MLAAALPTIIDALTPDGQVPQGDAAGGFDLGSMLGGLSERRTQAALAAGGTSAR